MSFTSTPVRANGGTVISAWWNSLRSAGIILENKVDAILGGGASSSEATFAIGNNQTSQDITGLIVSSLYRRTDIKYWVRRKATDDVMEVGTLTVMYNGTNFYLSRSSAETPTVSGMDFDVHSTTGQITYTSSNMAGSYDAAASKIGYTRTTQGTI